MPQKTQPVDLSESELAPSAGAKNDLDLAARLESASDAIDREVLSLSARPVDQMVDPIAAFHNRSNRFLTQAKEMEILGRLARWATGRSLLMAKAELARGKFEAWLRRHRDTLGFGKSSAENYMKLARKFPTATLFLAEETPLRGLYSPKKSEDDGDNNAAPDDAPTFEPKRKFPGPSRTEALMKSLTGLQKRLRLVTESDVRITGDQLVQLKLVKTEIDRFFKTILSQHS